MTASRSERSREQDEAPVVLVTGATGGIGSAIVERFAADGWRVLGVDRTVDAPRVERDGVAYHQADVTDLDQMIEAIDVAVGMGCLRAAIANAGVQTESFADFVDCEGPRIWRPTLEVNVVGVLSTFLATARHLVAHGREGTLLATASTAGLKPEPGLPAYSASKAAVVALVQSLALELGHRGITVNAVAPGPTATERQAQVIEERTQVTTEHATETPAARRERHRNEGRPIGGLASPEDVANALRWLASDEARYMTGQTLVLDGGANLV